MNLHEVIEGQLGLFSSHLDPDGLGRVPAVLDRGQPHRPDRRTIRRACLLALDLLGPGGPGDTEPGPVRLDLQKHDRLSFTVSALSPSGGYARDSRLYKLDSQVAPVSWPVDLTVKSRRGSDAHGPTAND